MCIRIIARTLNLASTSLGHLFSWLLREGDEMRLCHISSPSPTLKTKSIPERSLGEYFSIYSSICAINRIPI